MFGACQELMRGLYMSYSEVTLVSKQCPTRGTYTASRVTLVLYSYHLASWAIAWPNRAGVRKNYYIRLLIRLIFCRFSLIYEGWLNAKSLHGSMG